MKCIDCKLFTGHINGRCTMCSKGLQCVTLPIHITTYHLRWILRKTKPPINIAKEKFLAKMGCKEIDIDYLWADQACVLKRLYDQHNDTGNLDFEHILLRKTVDPWELKESTYFTKAFCYYYNDEEYLLSRTFPKTFSKKDIFQNAYLYFLPLFNKLIKSNECGVNFND